jgi:acetyltransferase-like isoleucine patch superfamily enzyme
MRREINNAISVLHSAIRFAWMKLINGKRFHSDIIERFSPNVVFEVIKGGKVSLGRKVRVHSGCKIKVRKGAELTIGDDVKMNYNCIVVCRDRISIGEGTEFGPSVFLYDHDHDFRVGLKENEFKNAPVIIGKRCWIGANTVVLKGSIIGDDCVIGAGSVVSGTIPNRTILIQKRENVFSSYR